MFFNFNLFFILLFNFMILITGATGFLGNYLVNEYLSEGYEVRVLMRNPEQRSFPWKDMVDIAEGDILDVMALDKAMSGVEYVVHAAAMVSFWRKQRDQLMKTNVEGTANVVNLCLEHKIAKLVHVSSIATMGLTSDGTLITEDTPWKSEFISSNYAKSKRKAEMEIHRGIAEGLNAVMVNPGVILGAGDWTKGTAKMFSVVNRGLRFYPDGGSGMVAAKDVAKACRLVMENDTENGERYLLVGENMTFGEIFTEIAISLGKTPPRWKLPGWLSLAAGRASEAISRLSGTEPIVSLESMRSSLKRRRFDGSKIRGLGLEYTPIREVVIEAGGKFNEEVSKNHI